jgi:3-methylcrotonyl-CoA carboxylase alpha subunit
VRSVYRSDAGSREVTVVPRPDGAYDVTVDGACTIASGHVENGSVYVARGGRRLAARVSREGAQRYVTIAGLGDAILERVADGPRRRADHHAGDLTAPMPGRVVAVRVSPGDVIEKGRVLVIVEAMKMEMPIVAPHAGRVVAVHATPGELCDASVALVEIAEDEA